METGQKIILTSNNISDSIYELSIQVNLSGLSFFVLNSMDSKIEFLESVRFDKKQTPQELLDRLIHNFNRLEGLQKQFGRVTVIHDNELATLVPKPLFDESNLVDYLKFNTRILKTDFITYDALTIEDIMVVYVPLVNINNFIFERFGSFEYKHSATILLNRLLTLEKNSNLLKMYINIEDSHFEIVVVENNKLKFFNRFEYNTKEDFIYYLLFTAEQLQLNPEEFPLVLMGSVDENDALYQIAYKYVRHVSLLPNESMLYSNNASSKHFTLLNSL
ncbi:MAG: DUF3822 family protein [Flavobacteriaceae bacterium]|jgi:hypothetical protein|nr:DUF3822 family protein [Formosa sp.]MDG1374747.1 DUF3822 family protein [Flavobacteriaceae bacterium]MDG2498727.1 DUF3822 family protein [Flavobacteriaceae bacterium]